MLYEEPTEKGKNSDYELGVRRSTMLPSKFGDLMNPGWPAKTRSEGKIEFNEDGVSLLGIKRDGIIQGEYFASYLPKIPIQPINQKAAKYIMDRLEGGRIVPDSWTDGKLVAKYKVSNKYPRIDYLYLYAHVCIHIRIYFSNIFLFRLEVP